MPKKEKQRGMFDREIKDPEVVRQLVEAIETLEDEGNIDTVKAMRDAKKLIDTTIEGMKPKPGERIRVGDYVIPIQQRSGGGFDVKAWSKPVRGKVAVISENGATS